MADCAFDADDHAFMARALRLAERGLASTQPNPRVGCVLAMHGQRIAEGWHQLAGGAHAESIALSEAGDRARGATAYVTLEPCAHVGRTPPCADALLAAGVARVVFACEDPNPQVDGAGLARLSAAGVRVQGGLLREAARELNRGFFSRFERGRPWVRVKMAMSIDGRTALANGESRWISGAAARTDVQRWRARSSAILTGSGTVRSDDPRLTVRIGQAQATDAAALPAPPAEMPRFQPLRVVLDTGLATPAQAHVLDGSAPTLVLHAPDARRAAHFSRVECAPVALRRETLDLPAVLALLAARGVNELQVEAGATLVGALFEADCVDELLVYSASVLLGDSARPMATLAALPGIAAARRLRVVDARAIGADWRVLSRT